MFLFCLFPADGSLPKEPKGDVSSQIAGKQTLHTVVHVHYSLSLLPRQGYVGVCVCWCWKTSVFFIVVEMTLTHARLIFQCSQWQRQVTVTVASPLSPPPSPSHTVFPSPWLATCTRLRSDSRVSVMSWEGRCRAVFPALCPLLLLLCTSALSSIMTCCLSSDLPVVFTSKAGCVLMVCSCI